MKKTLIIHAGMHKTGSSAIQHALYLNRQELLMQGVLYPLTGLVYDAQIGYRHLELRKSLADISSASEILTRLHAEINDSQCHTIVISNEDILSPGKQIVEGVRLLTEHYNVKLVCYLRDPIDYFNAKYKEWVRQQGFCGEPAEFVLEHLDYLHWDQLLTPWFKLLPKHAISVRKYERNLLVNQSSIDDFCDALEQNWNVKLKDCLVDVPATKNEGLSNNQILLTLIKNRHFKETLNSKGSQQKLLGLMSKLKTSEKQGLVFGREVARQIKARNWSARFYCKNKLAINFTMPPIDELVFDESFALEELRVEYKHALAAIVSTNAALVVK